MGENKGTFMTNGQSLTMGDYLTSPNGVFFALMQADGNFCVYRGTGPNDIHGDALWAASGGWSGVFKDGSVTYFVTLQDDGSLLGWVPQSNLPKDRNELWSIPDEDDRVADKPPFFVTLEDDGRVCIYKGTGPGDNRGLAWGSDKRDPVDDCDEITDIEYDVKAVKLVNSSSPEFYRQTFHNNVDREQTFTIHGSAAVAEMSGWSNVLMGKVGVKTNFKAGVPVLAEGKVEVSLEVSDTYTWNGSTTRTTTYSFDQPLAVPPHKTYVAVVAARVSSIQVPYAVKGTLVLKSKLRIAGGRSKGTYTGTNSHDWTVTISEQAATPVHGQEHAGGQATAPLDIRPTTRALEVRRIEAP